MDAEAAGTIRGRPRADRRASRRYGGFTYRPPREARRARLGRRLQHRHGASARRRPADARAVSGRTVRQARRSCSPKSIRGRSRCSSSRPRASSRAIRRSWRTRASTSTRYQPLLSQDSIARRTSTTQRSTVKQLEAALQVDQAAIDTARLNLSYHARDGADRGRVGLRLVDAGNVVTASAPPDRRRSPRSSRSPSCSRCRKTRCARAAPHSRAARSCPSTPSIAAGRRSWPADRSSRSTIRSIRPPARCALKAIFDNRDHALFPAQFVNVQLVADARRDQLVVPAAAVQHGPQGAFVYVVQDGKAVVRRVTVGIVEAEQRRRSPRDSTAGESVIIDGVDRLREGSRVVGGRGR